jgi:hypothetical protein
VCFQEGESLYHNELSKANVEIVLWGHWELDIQPKIVDME